VSSLADRIQSDVVAAMKAREALKVETLRGLSSDLKYKRIQLGRDLEDDDVVAVLRSAAKRRRESALAFEKGGREDLAQKEFSELALIELYLPAELSDADLDALVKAAITESGATGARDMGKVMSAVMPKVAGRADGNRVRSRVQTLLSG
jgi:uncharacterized protein YqeY